MRKTLYIILIIIVVAIGAYLLLFQPPYSEPNPNGPSQPALSASPQQTPANQERPASTVIGSSVEGRDITAYHYGNGENEILLIGGIHGGYEWNTVLLAHQAMDYFEANPNEIPQNVRVTVLPVLNPDGLNEIVGTAGRFSAAAVPSQLSQTIPGRFNANDVDLGRNFDCQWQANAVWQDRAVSGGNAPFSEPESRAIRDYVLQNRPAATVTWYSAAGGVYASSCNNGISAQTRQLMEAYADGSEYPAYDTFDFYAITGDMVNWFAKQNIPSISVLLSNHTDTEWAKNRAGIEAVMSLYAE